MSVREGWFSFEGVPLKWHYPIGLLHDSFSGVEPAEQASNARREENGDNTDVAPWPLEVHFGEWPEGNIARLDKEGKVMHDAFINNVKEADYLRNGNARGIMSLPKSDSTQLWGAVQINDLKGFNAINSKLLDAPGTKLRHVPVRIYLPASDCPTGVDEVLTQGTLKVLQPLVPLAVSSNPSIKLEQETFI
ncbi:MAG: autophagy protein 5 [Piccolia ochrophora]|nr:MAG: autophagy protein 5 [Piccolia ochrophora]